MNERKKSFEVRRLSCILVIASSVLMGAGSPATEAKAKGDRDRIRRSVIQRWLGRPELKAADEKHPDLVALCSGPLVLFAIGEDLPKLSRKTLE